MESQLESISQLGLAFFGLTLDNVPQARAAIFTQIHEIVFHGKGGYSWHDVYNMPIWLRRFTFNKINEFYKKENESYENSKSGGKDTKNLVTPSGKVNTPEFLKTSNHNKKQSSYN
tara:strand:+ start:110 stop:457 length:348 start_codon:yes stop_codon:yes gene_type:complete